MKRVIITSSVLALTFGLSACASVNEPLSPLHGHASQRNFVASVDDPRPAEGNPTTDARVVDAAIERYRSGEVVPPESAGGFEPGGGN